jgi:hypothetical protein
MAYKDREKKRENDRNYYRNRLHNDQDFREKEKERKRKYMRNEYNYDARFYITARMRKWKKYGIYINEWHDYQYLFKKSNRQCQICNKPLKMTIFEKGENETAHLDHDPTTGQIRGILCHGCNTALGNLEKYLDNAQKYIADHNIKLNTSMGPRLNSRGDQLCFQLY